MPWITQCMASTLGYRVVMVDNASTDDTVSYVTKQYPNTHIIKSDINLGFGQANNLGIAYALKQGCDYVFLLNQDAYLQENTIEKLIEIQQARPEFGVLSPIHLNGAGDKLDANFSNYVAVKHNADFYSDFVLKKDEKLLYTVPFVNAAGWLINRRTLETVGGFDPIFFHYGEDENYCQRLHFHGLKIAVATNSFLRHDREERKHPTPAEKDSNYLNDLERKWKMLFGNINEENLDNMKEQLQKKKRALLKTRLKLQSNPKLEGEIALIQRILPELIQSRTRNKEKGPNYLQ